MNRPNHQPPDLEQRRKAVRRTAWFVGLLAVAIFVGFMFFVWINTHGG